MTNRATSRSRPIALAATTTFVLLSAIGLVPTAASAAWAAHGSGSASGAADVMPAGTAPSGAPSRTSITITWSAAQFSNGASVAGYVIDRYSSATGVMETVGAGCSGVVAATTCTEQSVPPGAWTYTDTPVQLSWTGGQSPQSAVISSS